MWVISKDGESFAETEYATKEAAVQAVKAIGGGHVGELEAYVPTVDAWEVLDNVLGLAVEELSEDVVDDWLQIEDESDARVADLHARLNAVFTAWLKETDLTPDFQVVSTTEVIT